MKINVKPVSMYRIFALTAWIPFLASCQQPASDLTKLKIVILRHGEKYDTGENLSCQGFNRSLALPDMVVKKFGKPDFAYVPSLKNDSSTHHARMFQTITPLAVKYQLAVNTLFDETNATGLAADVKKRRGTVLLVWEHKNIMPIAQALGLSNFPKWKGEDFDSIWIVTFNAAGQPALSFDKEGLAPAAACN